ncbi:hypothetical protein CK203_059000 [Vitis vinifera]|uniref:Retrotransposon gag domain-containing protein n=1 Tax=Vitis vinifera TaxID=29760 RepID=A0A438GEN5_VITVI|nr:hypothetical protein CK203_059000 [Vitis vinifera]
MALPPPSGLMTKPKYLPTIKEGNRASGTIYMNLHKRGRVCPDTLSGRLLQEQLNQESILVEIVRPSIWQLRGSPGTRGLNIGAVCGKITDSVTSKDDHTSRSHSSDSKIKRRKRGATHPSFINGASPSSAFKRPVANQGHNQSQYTLGQREPSKKQATLDHMSHTHPCIELPARKAQALLIFQQKDNAIENPVVKLNARETRPTGAWEAKATSSHYLGSAPDPIATPMVQNVLPHRDPMVTPMVQNVHPHLAARQAGRNLPNEPPIGSISKRLDDMLSTPSCSHIIHFEPPRGFLVPKFSTYDGSSDPFDHIMHYRQLMTLDIGNDALLCKGPIEAFVGQYLCFARHKQNISTLQNIKMQDNESLREFVKRFGQAVLQVEAYNMDVVLQIFKQSICPGTPFFESLAKKPLTTMDDLFRRASKYSMLEHDVRDTTQQVLVAGQASRRGAERSAKLPDRPRPSDRRQEGPSHPELPPLTPLSISYEKFLPMIQDISDFRWPRPLGMDPSKRDHSKKCVFHKEHGHTTEECRCLHYLVERLIRRDI